MKGIPLLFIGIKGAVVAINRLSGAIVWQTDLRGSTFVNLVDDGERVYALSHGEISCLDAGTGVRIWHNPLKGFGIGLGALLVSGRPNNAAASAARISAEQQHAATAAASSSAAT